MPRVDYDFRVTVPQVWDPVAERLVPDQRVFRVGFDHPSLGRPRSDQVDAIRYAFEGFSRAADGAAEALERIRRQHLELLERPRDGG